MGAAAETPGQLSPASQPPTPTKRLGNPSVWRLVSPLPDFLELVTTTNQLHTTRSAFPTTTKKRPTGRKWHAFRRVSDQCTCAWARGHCHCRWVGLSWPRIALASCRGWYYPLPGNPPDRDPELCRLCRRVNNTRTTHQRNTMGMLTTCPGMCVNLYSVCVCPKSCREDTACPNYHH